MVVGILVCVFAVIFAGALIYIEREIREVKDLIEGITHYLPEFEIVDQDFSPQDDANLRKRLLN